MGRLLLWIAFFLVPAVTFSEPRTWTDVSGSFTVEAEFVETHDEAVILKKADGAAISVPVSRLCEKDREAVDFLERCGNLLDALRSKDQTARNEAARSLLSRGVHEVAISPILDFIKSEIAELSSLTPLGKKPVEQIPVKGDETSLVRIKADPRAYLGKPVVLVGRISASTTYWGRYSEASYYSLDFDELNESARKTFEGASLYVPRTFSALLVERMVRTEEEGADGLIVRVKATIDPSNYREADDYDEMEVLDWQLLDRDAGNWRPWALEGFSNGLRLLASLDDVDALAGLVNQPQSYGPEAVNDFVRWLAAFKLTELEAIDYSAVAPIVEIIKLDFNQANASG